MNWKHRQYSIFILPSAGTCGRKKDVHRIYNSLSYHPLSNAPVRYESSHSCPFLTCCCWYICGLSHSCSYFHWIYGLVTLCFRSIHTSSQRWTVSALQQPLLHQQPTAQHSTARRCHSPLSAQTLCRFGWLLSCQLVVLRLVGQAPAFLFFLRANRNKTLPFNDGFRLKLFYEDQTQVDSLFQTFNWS